MKNNGKETAGYQFDRANMDDRERRQWARQAGNKGRNRAESLSEDWEKKVESGRGRGKKKSLMQDVSKIGFGG